MTKHLLRNPLFILCFLFPAAIFSQSVDVETILKPFTEKKKSKLMILGTFHYQDGGKDGYKPKFPVNIKSEKRQAEVKELLDLLAKFKPTKIAIENMQEYQGFHDSLYTEFQAGRYKPGENEIFQVCYQLANKMGHKKVFTVDAPRRFYENRLNEDSFAVKHQQEKYFNSIYDTLYTRLYTYEDSLKTTMSLRNYYLHRNDPRMISNSHGHYIIGSYKLAADGHYPGADAATSWVNRNMRIFANLMQLAASSNEERIFLMIGAGHLPILRFLAMSSPEIEFVDVRDYLK